MFKSFYFSALMLVVATPATFADDLFSEVSIDSVYSTSTNNNSGPRATKQDGRRLGGIDSLTSELLGAGYEPKRVNDTVVSIKMQRGDWSIPVLVSVTEDGDKLWLGMMLSKISDEKKLPTDKLLQLLAANQQHGPASFVYSRNRGRIELHLALENRNISSELLTAKLESMAAIVEKTEKLWNLGESIKTTEPITPQKDTTPVAKPATTTPATTPSVQPSLVGTWSAVRGATEAFALKINTDGTFLLAYVKGKQSVKSQGKATLNGQLLVLKGSDGTTLTGTIQVQGNEFNFTPTGGKASQSLKFKKQ